MKGNSDNGFMCRPLLARRQDAVVCLSKIGTTGQQRIPIRAHTRVRPYVIKEILLNSCAIHALLNV